MLYCCHSYSFSQTNDNHNAIIAFWGDPKRVNSLSGVIEWRVKVSLGVSSSRTQRAGQPEFYESNTGDSCQKSVHPPTQQQGRESGESQVGYTRMVGWHRYLGLGQI